MSLLAESVWIEPSFSQQTDEEEPVEPFVERGRLEPLAGGVQGHIGDALLALSLPVALVHGHDDMTIPLSRSREYLEAARIAGGDVELIEPSPCGHRSHIDPRTAAWRAAVEWLSVQRQTSQQAVR